MKQEGVGRGSRRASEGVQSHGTWHMAHGQSHGWGEVTPEISPEDGTAEEFLNLRWFNIQL